MDMRALFQSTHSLRSATALADLDMMHMWVSIHALLAECDAMNNQIKLNDGVSIHALLAECDHIRRRIARRTSCFNPRTPCGVRQPPGNENTKTKRFQSTHSLRSATTQAASLARSPKSFNPRTPCGVRQINAYGHKSILRFQSTHSLRSATIGSRRKTATDKVSIHALLAECDIPLGLSSSGG